MVSNSDRELAVLNCSQLITLAGPPRPRIRSEMAELSIITDGAMFVRGARIEAVGTGAEIETLLSSKTQVIDAKKRVVLPGFVDAHTHPVFAGNRVDEFEQRAAGRTYQEIAARGGGIRSTVIRTRQASEEELFDTGCRYQEWFLRCGTTTIEAKSGYGLSLEAELKLLHVIRSLNATGPLHYVPTFLGAHDVPCRPAATTGSVGFYGLMFVSLGSIIGSGWLLGALNAAEKAGPASILSWISRLACWRCSR
jgi:imidazolonepropionase